MAQCSVDGCDEAARARGLCDRHYDQWRYRNRDHKPCTVEGCDRAAVLYGRCEAHNPNLGQCQAEGCDRDAAEKGLCSVHYKRSKRGTLYCRECGALAESRGLCAEHKLCSMDGCEARSHAGRLCYRHYQRWQRGTLYGPPRAVPVCSVPGCNRSPKARDLCHKHYQRWLRTNEADDDGGGYTGFSRLLAERLRQWEEAHGWKSVPKERWAEALARRDS